MRKLPIRFCDDPRARDVMCNHCKHKHKFATCEAFPEGIPKELIARGEHDTPFQNDNGIRFEPKEN